MLHRALTALGRFLLVVVSFGVFSAPFSAANTRDFAAFYALQAASQTAASYSVTFTMTIFNHSEAPVTDATIVLRGCPTPAQSCTEFQHVNIDANHWVRLSTRITIPGPLYDRWQKGGRPELIIEFTNIAGEKQNERVDATLDASGTRMPAE